MERLPETTRTEPDENGIFTEISWKYNEKNQLVKVTKIIKRTTTTRRVKKAVLERKKWAKFGAAVDGSYEATTRISEDEVFIEPVGNSIINVSNFKPPKKKTTEKWVPKSRISGIKREFKLPEPTQNKFNSGYQPPHKRNGGSSQVKRFNNNDCGIRISNIEPQYTEKDLRDILEKDFNFYPKRIKLVTDRHTKISKGYAFVNFGTEKEVLEAIEGLNRKYLGHSVLSVEKVRPRVP